MNAEKAVGAMCRRGSRVRKGRGNETRDVSDSVEFRGWRERVLINVVSMYIEFRKQGLGRRKAALHSSSILSFRNAILTFSFQSYHLAAQSCCLVRHPIIWFLHSIPIICNPILFVTPR